MTTCGWDEHKYLNYLKDKLPMVAKVADFGFNVGDFTIEWLRRFPMSEVWGFEPIPEIFNTAAHRFKGHNNIQLYNWGIHNKTTEHEIYFLQGDFSSAYHPDF